CARGLSSDRSGASWDYFDSW
nr:immunoglobulin heavy chain junction region [Macaca mulatta]MOY21260.1 immunoglobulin heavy chain junction region [Macaca mulatta]MOY21406.1 immunoglobulin heavy chain junction region [Macaca mulatta]MOY22123.1 immunoglobulin heavy chain junction region [Macaca mulatta]MOY22150.1 immunoglobulin heavy chain junction region [Macaca mulatta]